MSSYETYADGVRDAKNDLAEGWVDENMTVTFIAESLKATVGASDEYVRGYLTVVGV